MSTCTFCLKSFGLMKVNCGRVKLPGTVPAISMNGHDVPFPKKRSNDARFAVDSNVEVAGPPLVGSTPRIRLNANSVLARRCPHFVKWEDPTKGVLLNAGSASLNMSMADGSSPPAASSGRG